MAKILSISTLPHSEPSLMIRANASFVYPICLMGYDPVTEDTPVVRSSTQP
jgi:hypothetical protein